MKKQKVLICYIDLSVVIKRITHEADSTKTLSEFAHAQSQGFNLMSSELLGLELSGFLHRQVDEEYSRSVIEQQKSVALAGIELIKINTQILKRASAFPFPHLGSLDSIHLGTAQAIGASHFLTRDRQLLRACNEVGIKTTF